MSRRTEIIVALDTDLPHARYIIERTNAKWFKLGVEMIHNPQAFELALEIRAQGKYLFLDSKLSDTPITTTRTVDYIAKTWKPNLLSVRSNIHAAMEAASGNTNIIDVPYLTTDVVAKWTPTEADGVVCRASLVGEYRSRHGGRDIIIVVPGIRLPGDSARHHKDATPEKCPDADFLVIGEPITRANNPQTAYENYLSYTEYK